jgi:hypothetical protein
MSHLKGGMALISKARNELSYSTQSQAVETEVARNPASQNLVLNSADRFITGVVPSSISSGAVNQPWNNFRLQRPQALMDAFATRVGVSEVRMPWYIPNINSNNTKGMGLTYNDGSTLTFVPLSFPTGFYTPTQFCIAWNDGVFYSATAGITPPNLSFDANLKTFTLTPTTPFGLTIDYSDSLANYVNNPSVFQMMGVDYNQLFSPTGAVYYSTALSFLPTDFLYTPYFDIVSLKLSQYSTNRDGSSSSQIKPLVARVYLNNEVSLSSASGVEGHTPFTIYRQFKNPKFVMWNKDSFVDWLDISLYDAWGQLLPLPVYSYKRFGIPSILDITAFGAYPDFQITLLASEN